MVPVFLHGTRGIKLGTLHLRPAEGGPLKACQDVLEEVEAELRVQPYFVEYAAEKRGYTITVGYVL